MVLSDRFLTAVKAFLEVRGVDLPGVSIRDWEGEFGEMQIVLDVEDEPVEDEDLRGQYEIPASLNLRCKSGVDDAERRAMFAHLEELMNGTVGEEWDLVNWMRTAVDRGIPGEQLGVFEMLVGAGSWDISDEEVMGTIQFTVHAVGVDLAAENFNGV